MADYLLNFTRLMILGRYARHLYSLSFLLPVLTLSTIRLGSFQVRESNAVFISVYLQHFTADEQAKVQMCLFWWPSKPKDKDFSGLLLECSVKAWLSRVYDSHL